MLRNEERLARVGWLAPLAVLGFSGVLALAEGPNGWAPLLSTVTAQFYIAWMLASALRLRPKARVLGSVAFVVGMPIVCFMVGLLTRGGPRLAYWLWIIPGMYFLYFVSLIRSAFQHLV